MNGYRSFSFTVPGKGHECQDASNHEDKDDDVCIAVVADGHGDSNCFRSAQGASIAVACATEGIKLFVREYKKLFCPENQKGLFKKPQHPEIPSQIEFEKLIRKKLLMQIVHSWNSAVMKHYQDKPFTDDELNKSSKKYRDYYNKGERISKAYGTSLIAAAITPWYWFGFHIGDGRFSVLNTDGKGEQPVPWDERCYLNVTTSICDDDILDEDKQGIRSYLSFTSDKVPPIAFFLCTDGVDDNYPVEENEVYLYRLYRETVITFADEGFDSTCAQLKELAEGFATKGKGDDTSFAGIVNLEEIKRAAPEWKIKIAEGAVKREEEKRIAEEKAAETTGIDIFSDGEFISPRPINECENTNNKETAKIKADEENTEDSKEKKVEIATALINLKQTDFEAKNAADAYQKNLKKL